MADAAVQDRPATPPTAAAPEEAAAPVAAAGAKSPTPTPAPAVKDQNIVEETLRDLSAMSLRDWIVRTVLVGFLAASAVVCWQLIIVSTASEIPIVVVLSGSMEPGYQRGDLLVLVSPNREFEVGDIIVFKLREREIPIVHRVHRLHIATNGTKYILTKGDNNMYDDVALYPPGQFFIEPDRGDVMGRSVVYLPFVGQFTILMADVQGLRVATLLTLLVVVFITFEE